MDWASHYPAFADPDESKLTLSGTRKLLKDVEVADIGCGFGGLLIGLAPVLPETLMVGKSRTVPCRYDFTRFVKTNGYVFQVLKSEAKSQNTSKSASQLCATNKPDSAPPLPLQHQHLLPQQRN
jgi:tRNA (guanine-N7-)-methyltransferase